MNIKVIDEYGKTYSSTYVKRAKGLVKNKRAYWVDDEHTTICLVAPSKNKLEEQAMERKDYQQLILNVESHIHMCSNSVEYNLGYAAARELANEYNQIVDELKSAQLKWAKRIETIDLEVYSNSFGDNATGLIEVAWIKYRTILARLKVELAEFEETNKQEAIGSKPNETNQTVNESNVDNIKFFDFGNKAKNDKVHININVDNFKKIGDEMAEEGNKFVAKMKDWAQKFGEQSYNENIKTQENEEGLQNTISVNGKTIEIVNCKNNNGFSSEHLRRLKRDIKGKDYEEVYDCLKECIDKLFKSNLKEIDNDSYMEYVDELEDLIDEKNDALEELVDNIENSIDALGDSFASDSDAVEIRREIECLEVMRKKYEAIQERFEQLNEQLD